MTTKTTNKRTPTQKKNAMTLGGFLAGAFIGGLAGSGAMLFLAPQSGRKTRAQFWSQGLKIRKDTMQTVADGVSQVQTKAHDLSETMHKQVENLQERGQNVVDDSKERLITAVHDGKERLSNAVSDGKDGVSKAVQTGKTAVHDATA